MIGLIKTHQLTKKSRTNLWLALSWVKDDPKKGYRLSLKVHGQAIDCGYVEHKKQELTKKSGIYPKSTDPKITSKGTLAYPRRYMVQTFPGDLN